MAHTAQCSSYPRCRAPCRRRQQVDPPRPAQSRQVHRGHHHPTPLNRTAGNRILINMLFFILSLRYYGNECQVTHNVLSIKALPKVQWLSCCYLVMFH